MFIFSSKSVLLLRGWWRCICKPHRLSHLPKNVGRLWHCGRYGRFAYGGVCFPADKRSETMDPIRRFFVSAFGTCKDRLADVSCILSDQKRRNGRRFARSCFAVPSRFWSCWQGLCFWKRISALRSCFARYFLLFILQPGQGWFI